MKFTPDGYTEPLVPRILGLILGGLLFLVGLIGMVFGWLCLGILFLIIGALTALNETGTQRIRVTRSKLLIEEESRVRGMLIGPRRNRLTWDETSAVSLEPDHVLLTRKDGTTLILAKGAPAPELQKLKNRIDQSREG